MARSVIVERVLLVAGAPDTGKSVQLRSMFLDPRLGTDGRSPDGRRLRETSRLSPSRSLYLRLSSPHEMGESVDKFLAKIAAKTGEGRWCVASAVQVEAAQEMPNLPNVVAAIQDRFAPERIRVALLSPDRHRALLPAVGDAMSAVQATPTVEVMCIDCAFARSKRSAIGRCVRLLVGRA